MTKRRQRPAPGTNVDLTELRGFEVLGEPLDVLVSCVQRFRFGEPRDDGMVEIGASMPGRELDALARAMGRVELPIADDPRPAGERNLDRLVLVVERVMEAARAVAHGRRNEAARSQFERIGLPG